MLHVGGVLVAPGDGVLEQGDRFVGTLFGEPGRVGAGAVRPCTKGIQAGRVIRLVGLERQGEASVIIVSPRIPLKSAALSVTTN